jgi:hypothetical protein
MRRRTGNLGQCWLGVVWNKPFIAVSTSALWTDIHVTTELVEKTETKSDSQAETMNRLEILEKKVALLQEELEAWEETFEILASNPNIVAELEEADKDFEKGKFLSHKEAMKEMGLTDDDLAAEI